MLLGPLPVRGNIEAVLRPFLRVGVNIFPYFLPIILTLDDVIMEGTLPEVFHPDLPAAFYRAQGFERAYRVRDRRGEPWSSRPFRDGYEQIHMVWHYNIFIDRKVETLFDLKYVSLYYSPAFRQSQIGRSKPLPLRKHGTICRVCRVCRQ